MNISTKKMFDQLISSCLVSANHVTEEAWEAMYPVPALSRVEGISSLRLDIFEYESATELGFLLHSAKCR